VGHKPQKILQVNHTPNESALTGAAMLSKRRSMKVHVVKLVRTVTYFFFGGGGGGI